MVLLVLIIREISHYMSTLHTTVGVHLALGMCTLNTRFSMNLNCRDQCRGN